MQKKTLRKSHDAMARFLRTLVRYSQKTYGDGPERRTAFAHIDAAQLKKRAVVTAGEGISR